MDKFYEKLVEKYGVAFQIEKTIEEMAELMQVLCYCKTKSDQYSDKELRRRISDEMSHVLMTFESLKVIFKISEDDIKNEIELKKKLLKFQDEVQNK